MTDHATAQPDAYEALVVGAGPAGLMAAQTLGRQRRRVLVVDDQRPRNERAQNMHMYLSRDGLPPAELRALARAEMEAYATVELATGHVSSLTGEQGAFTATVDGRTVTAPVVLLATGVEDVIEDLPGLREHWGRGVYHCGYCHGFESTGRTIGVVSQVATDAMLAYYLHDRFSDDVVLFSRGTEIPAELRATVEGSGVRIIDAPVTAVTGEEPAMKVHVEGQEPVARELVFHRPPTRQRSDLAERLGCTIAESGTVVVDAMLRTTVPGVYAAGDCASPEGLPGATTFVTSAVGDGQRAAVWMEQEILMASLPRG